TDTSVETLFLKARRHAPSTTEDFLRALYEKRFYQISSFPQWMEHPLHRTKAILSLPNQEQTPEVTGLLCSLEPTLLEEVQNRIRPIADIFSHFSPTQPEKLSAQERLQVICSKEYQDQLSIRYLDKKNQFENRYELPTATVLSKEASEAFLTRRKDKCTLDGISYAYPTKDKEGNALCQFDTEELLTFIIDRETENPKKTTLITRSLSHSLGKKKLTDMLTDYRPIHQEWMEGQCDGIKLYVLEHQIFEEEYQKLPSSDNKRACQEFRF
ncbi:MAG: hypothetical protein HYW85_03580, partial [Deltaproteobacteria bacterium]|nr:hypothetical protein [Deltaproteobacteria bacterium]